MMLKSIAFVACIAAGDFLATKPPLYRLWLANPAGKIHEILADFLSRRLDGVDVTVISQDKRYKVAAHFPMPVCMSEEFYLIGPGNELLAIGCLDPIFPALSIPQISQAMRRYETEIGKGRNPTSLARSPGGGF
jgi:hypothetical protein